MTKTCRPDVYYNKVSRAWDELEAAGEPVSARAIQKRVGGSMRDVHAAYQQVSLDRRAAALNEAAADELPEAVERRARELWAEALQIANETNARQSAELERLRAERQAEIGDLLESIAELETERDAARAEVEALQARCDESDETIGELERRLETSEAVRSALETVLAGREAAGKDGRSEGDPSEEPVDMDRTPEFLPLLERMQETVPATTGRVDAGAQPKTAAKKRGTASRRRDGAAVPEAETGPADG